MNLHNEIYLGSNQRKSLFDLEIPEKWNQEMIIFVHGFMGFKDWGAWDLVQHFFVSKGYGFAKFNLSHNGGTESNGIDFPDIVAFAENTYSKEIADIQLFRKHIMTLVNPVTISMIGHSRGGACALLHAKHHPVNRLILWAAICDIGSRFPKGIELEDWKKTGVRYILNARTQQELPQNYTLYEDFIMNEQLLNIEAAARVSTSPILVIHGSSDKSVPMEEGKQIARWSGSAIEIIEGADHVFGAMHPWEKPEMPIQLASVCDKSLTFLTR